jgi:hypothetical protein
MKKYRILINGRNFILDMGDGVAKHGFYTTRFVEASDSDDAEFKAMASIRKRDDIKPMLRNAAGDLPMLYAEEIQEIESFEGVENLEQGFAWYREGGNAE